MINPKAKIMVTPAKIGILVSEFLMLSFFKVGSLLFCVLMPLVFDLYELFHSSGCRFGTKLSWK